MRACLPGTDVPAYLDAGARRLLAQGRAAFQELGLDRNAIVAVGRQCVILPFVGSTKLDTLVLALRARHLKASPFQHTVEVDGCSLEDLRLILAEIAQAPAPEGEALARFALAPPREKFDPYLSEALLVRTMVTEGLNAAALPEIARGLIDLLGR